MLSQMIFQHHIMTEITLQKVQKEFAAAAAQKVADLYPAGHKNLSKKIEAQQPAVKKDR